MDVREIFELSNVFDPAVLDGDATRLREVMLSHRGHDELLDAMLGAERCLHDSAALVGYALRDLLRGAEITGEEAHAVHRVALLVSVTDRRPDAIVDPGASATGLLTDDLESLASVADGSGDPAGPRSRFVADLRRRMQQGEGWSIWGERFTQALVDRLLELAQSFRLRAAQLDDVLGPAIAAGSRGAGFGLVLLAAGVMSGDPNASTHPAATELVLRLGASAVGLAHDVGRFMRGRGDKASRELVAQRFALPSHVIRLEDDDVGRALRAMLELELRDLAAALRYLDRSSPWPGVVRRAVTAFLELDGSAREVLADRPPVPASRETVMAEMRAVARRDGKVTTDERALLRGMDALLSDFEALASRVEEDQVVDFDELGQLRSMRSRILDGLFQIALGDDRITDDERELLVRAMELLPTVR